MIIGKTYNIYDKMLNTFNYNAVFIHNIMSKIIIYLINPHYYSEIQVIMGVQTPYSITVCISFYEHRDI